MNLEALKQAPRLLVEAALAPVQGSRFQPTGFPDLGAAEYKANGTAMLLVESAQSMANRLEAVCWDEATNDLLPTLAGLPYVRVVDKGGNVVTTSILESHRLNSPYILKGKDTPALAGLKKKLSELDKGRLDVHLLAEVLFSYDPNSLIHGVFLVNVGGKLRLPRMLSSFIEASDVDIAASGGLKRDDVDPSGDAKAGFGHVPFHRDEYTGTLTAYFNVDLAQARGFRLGEPAEALLVALSLFKIQRFLSHGMRLRTACDLKLVGAPKVTAPEGFELPPLSELETELPGLISAARGGFADPAITETVYAK